MQRCTYSGNRTIDFAFGDHALVMHDADVHEPLTVIRLFDLQPGESAEDGLRRIYAKLTDKKIAQRCVLAPYKPAAKRAGVKRYDFVPDKAYQKQLDKVKEDGVPDPPAATSARNPTRCSTSRCSRRAAREGHARRRRPGHPAVRRGDAAVASGEEVGDVREPRLASRSSRPYNVGSNEEGRGEEGRMKRKRESVNV